MAPQKKWMYSPSKAAKPQVPENQKALIAHNSFNLAYFRHTEQWWEVSTDLTLEQALDEIKTNPIFHPS